MASLIVLIAHTIVKRWYVFAFFGIYLFASVRQVGWLRTLAHIAVTFIPMLLIEEAGVQTGMIFGRYHYETVGNGDELWFGHVILVTALGWPFFTYAGWAVARWALGPRRLAVRGLGAIAFLLLLDLVMDPITARGDRWFLGRFHVWDETGFVFGVPLMNYLGWALSLVLILALWQWACPGAFSRLKRQARLDRRLNVTPGPPFTLLRGLRSPVEKGAGGLGLSFDPLGIALYAMLWLFHLVIAFAIGEWGIGLLGVFIFGALAFGTWRAGRWTVLANQLPFPRRQA